jgi:hypothetical protein
VSSYFQAFLPWLAVANHCFWRQSIILQSMNFQLAHAFYAAFSPIIVGRAEERFEFHPMPNQYWSF